MRPIDAINAFKARKAAKGRTAPRLGPRRTNEEIMATVPAWFHDLNSRQRKAALKVFARRPGTPAWLHDEMPAGPELQMMTCAGCRQLVRDCICRMQDGSLLSWGSESVLNDQYGSGA